jgi:adenylosuccinate synthase
MGRCFVETAQGWSLGINSGFYPYTTSRECSVTQALADLGVSPRAHRKSVACVRTYPIRVGNTHDGYSGDVYPDQHEVTFEDLDQTPELTTVTQRVRRIFTWSPTQYAQMLLANEPDGIFINFVNYLPEAKQEAFVNHYVVEAYVDTLGRVPDFVLLGFGPNNDDVELYEGDYA